MANVTIVSGQSVNNRFVTRRTAFRTSLQGYCTYIDVNLDLVYVATTDGGATWGSPVMIRSDTVIASDLWADWWTPGDNGNLIHFAYVATGASDVYYRNLNTSTGALSAEVVVFAGVSAVSGGAILSITKARSTGLTIAFNLDEGVERGTYKSTTAGATWFVTADGTEAGLVSTGEAFMMFPGAASDIADTVMLYADVSALEYSVKRYTKATNTWAETAIVTTPHFNNMGTALWSASIRHSDNHILVAIWNEFDDATADLLFYDIGPTSITAKTNLITDIDDCFGCSIYIDQTNSDIYVAYLGKSDGSETQGTSVNIWYKKSTDGGTTWGAETAYTEAAANFKIVNTDLGGTNDRFLPIGHSGTSAGTNSIIANFVNSVAFTGIGAPLAPAMYSNPDTFHVPTVVGGAAVVSGDDHMFAGIVPTRYLWVQAGGGGAGTVNSPYPTISQAAAAATPGTAIMVKAGTYNEKVQFPSRAGGTPTAPIWLFSADGKWAAKVVGPGGAAAYRAIGCLGGQNIIVDGFEVTGNSETGIDFSMSGNAGSDYTLWNTAITMPHNIVIRHCYVHHLATGQSHRDDSIRLSAVSNVEILDCVLIAPPGGLEAEDCIDCLAGDDVRIARCDIRGSGEAAAISIKGGSRRVQILNNYIHHAVYTRAVALGGWCNPANLCRPGTSFQCSEVLMQHNKMDNLSVSGSAQYGAMVFGAVDSEVSGNKFDCTGITGASAFYCTIGKTWAGIDGASIVQYNSWPRDLQIINNVYSGVATFFGYYQGGPDTVPYNFRVDFTPYNAAKRINLVNDSIVVSNNVSGGAWDHPTGPAPYTPSVGPITLSPGMVADTDTFHAPTVAAVGINVLQPALFTDADTFHTAKQAFVLVPEPPEGYGFFEDVDTFHDGAILTVGLANLAAPLFADADTFFSLTASDPSVVIVVTGSGGVALVAHRRRSRR